MSNPFKEDEPMGVFKETPYEQKETDTPQAAARLEKQEYSQFPSWDLLPPFKLVSRGRKK